MRSILKPFAAHKQESRLSMQAFESFWKQVLIRNPIFGFSILTPKPKNLTRMDAISSIISVKITRLSQS